MKNNPQSITSNEYLWCSDAQYREIESFLIVHFSKRGSILEGEKIACGRRLNTASYRIRTKWRIPLYVPCNR